MVQRGGLRGVFHFTPSGNRQCGHRHIDGVHLAEPLLVLCSGAGMEDDAINGHAGRVGCDARGIGVQQMQVRAIIDTFRAVGQRSAHERHLSGVLAHERIRGDHVDRHREIEIDDVAVMPEGIERLAKWTDRHDVIQGSRYDYDGGPFYWQYDFIVPLGIPNPIAPAAFGPAGYRVMDTLCFEGGLFRRNIVEKIGLPDPRFFIYWDDTMYGYRASKVTNPIVVPDVVLRRTREIGNWDIAGVRQLNSTSDMNRYHIMRNRGYMARYFMTYGDYRPLLFGLGTVLTAVKEVIRLTMVDREHFKTGIVQIAKGWWDSRKLLHDPEWQPMPPLK